MINSQFAVVCLVGGSLLVLGSLFIASLYLAYAVGVIGAFAAGFGLAGVVTR